MENKRILKLIAKEQLAVINGEEQTELNEWITSSQQNRQLYDEFIDDLADNEEEHADTSWKKFEQHYYKPKRNWWRNLSVVLAACMKLICSVGYWLTPGRRKSS